MRTVLIALLGAAPALVAAPASAGDIFEGRRLYNEHCTRCHAENGAPLLPGAPDFRRGEGLDAREAELLRSIRYGNRLMPGYETVLREREMLDVLVYLRSLRR